MTKYRVVRSPLKTTKVGVMPVYTLERKNGLWGWVIERTYNSVSDESAIEYAQRYLFHMHDEDVIVTEFEL
jgi:hypothetical protein